eukprot:GEMP01008853.1.p1 GENE.GEMP01008853.1~~GEMP01008853.1.p1  ORF type:complete len:767 (+),score=233.72 GEMP01008853.1:39-2339(+)
MKVLLALGPIPESYAGPEVWHGIAEFSKKTVQNCGRSFFDRFEKRGTDEVKDAQPSERSSDKDESAKKASNDKAKDVDNGKKQRKGNMLKLSDDLKGVDLYDMLGVAQGADDDELRKAFRAKSLLMHPDKHCDKSESQQKEIADKFVLLQESYDLLTDTAMRRKYDSSLEFDDSIPSKADAKDCETFEQFYDLFAPVFERNIKWSVKKGAPKLPDNDADFEKEVKPFYQFWLRFQSWRDMDNKILEEQGDDAFCDLKEADCREEKRWMERENGRIRQKYINEEHARILELTQLAEKYDGRMKAMRDEQIAKKNRNKLAKEATLREQKEKEEEEQRERDLLQKEEEERKASEKAKKEEAKNRVKKTRQDLRAIARDCAQVCLEQFQDLLLAMTTEQLEGFLGRLNVAAEDNHLVDEIWSTLRSFDMEPTNPKPATPATTVGEGSAADVSEEEEAEIILTTSKGKKSKKKKKDTSQPTSPVEDAATLRRKAAEEAARAEEKRVRDEKRVKAEEKKMAEKARKEQERGKREAEELVKQKAEAEKQAKAHRERVALEADKQRAEALAAKQMADEERDEDARSVRFSYHRQRLLERLGDMNVVAEAKRIASKPESASVLRALHAVEDEEQRLDAACVLLAQVYPAEEFFLLGKRQITVPNVSGVSNVMRNRTKKVRQQVRDAVKDALSSARTAAPVAGGDVVPCPEGVKPVLEGIYPLEGWENSPVAKVDESGKKGGKKKAKKEAEDEDLDALLQEFDVTVSDKKKKKGKK